MAKPHKPYFKPLTFNGRTQSQRAWAEELGISESAMSRRLSRAPSIERALTAQKHKKMREQKSLAKAARDAGLNPRTVYSRLNLGWSLRKALRVSAK
jgi:predicted transcriptional regulator